MADQMTKLYEPSRRPRLRVLERIAPPEGKYQRGTVVFSPGTQIGQYTPFEAASRVGDVDMAKAMGASPISEGGGNPIGQDPGVPRQAVYGRDQIELLAKSGYHVVVVAADVEINRKGHVIGALDTPDNDRYAEAIARAHNYRRERI